MSVTSSELAETGSFVSGKLVVVLIGIFGIPKQFRAINYIEANPVRANLAAAWEDWTWSSAYARSTGCGVVPDNTDIPILMT